MSFELDVLAVGEVLVDLISTEHADSLADAETFGRHLGGQPANVAMNVARLGGRSAFVGRVGDDGFGCFARAELVAAGVDVTGLRTDDESQTTICVIARQTGTPDFMVVRGADCNLDESDAAAALRVPARVVHTSAFALSCQPARDAILGVLAATRERGSLVSFDPNYHPSVWRDGDPLEAIAAALAHVDVTKPSLDDCRRLFGEGRAPEEYVALFHELGARLVVLTLGLDGVLVAARGGESRRYASRAVAVADTTGAGDALWAGLLMGLVDGHATDVAVLAGLELAALKLQYVGHLPASVDRSTLYRASGVTV